MSEMEWIYVPARRCPRWPSDVSVENTCGVCGHWRLAAEVRDVGSHYERRAVLVSARPVTVPERGPWERVGTAANLRAYCAWWRREHSEPCACVRQVLSTEHAASPWKDCPDCGGSGRVLWVPCAACEASGYHGYVEDFRIGCIPCNDAGRIRVTRIRPATREEVEAAQTLCGLCSDGGHDRIGAVTGHAPCLRCGGRGYTGPEWVEGGLVLAGEVA